MNGKKKTVLISKEARRALAAGMRGKHNPRWNGGISQYPGHADFKRTRLVVLRRTKGKCKICSAHANVVHHIDGSKDNHKIENLIALCDACHWAAHKEELQMVNGRVSDHPFRGTSKYRRLYGFSLWEMSALMGCAAGTISKLLRNPSTLDETIARVRKLAEDHKRQGGPK
jgi:hypothetical protein